MLTANDIFNQISAHAIANQLHHNLVIEPVVGEYIPQGDVNFLVLDKLPPNLVSGDRIAQLAPGTSRGSRHTIADRCLDAVDFFTYLNPNPLQGPILKTNAELTIEHPEHKHLIFPAGTILAVSYQRRYAAQLRRVAD